LAIESSEWGNDVPMLIAAFILSPFWAKFSSKLQLLWISETFELCFLQFVDEKVQWMHIDLAGPVWNEKKRTATGFGIATLVEWVLKNSS
jgi:hypothetical protein